MLGGLPPLRCGLLDNVIDISKFPLPEQRAEAIASGASGLA